MYDLEEFGYEIPQETQKGNRNFNQDGSIHPIASPEEDFGEHFFGGIGDILDGHNEVNILLNKITVAEDGVKSVDIQ